MIPFDQLDSSFIDKKFSLFELNNCLKFVGKYMTDELLEHSEISIYSSINFDSISTDTSK